MSNTPPPRKDNKQPPKNKQPMKTPKGSSLLVWLIVILAVVAFFQLFSGGSSTSEPSYTQFVRDLESGKITKIVFSGKDITYYLGATKKETNIPFDDPDLVQRIAEEHKDIEIISKKPSIFTALLSYWLPFIIFIGFWIFIMRSMQGGAGKAFSFGKSRAKMFTDSRSNKTFKDVAGVDEAKEELEEIIEFLKDPKKFQRLGGRIPKGVILLGPPGTGKTLLAKAVAGEAKVPFFSISGSDFVEMFVGVGASRVRDLFEQGKKHSPCIIFIDELDAVGRHRGAGLGGGHDEREQTLNQLLVEMDGFEDNESVIIIAATNRPDILDPALLRPGRFDRQVVVDRPDVKGREGILKVHAKKVPLAKDVDLSVIAKSTPGFSGADLENLVNEAALWGARIGHKSVHMDDFETAKDKVIMGKERRSMVLTDDQKRNTAYHEAGHVMIAKFIPGSDPIHKATIIPRGRSLGSTHFLPLDDRHTYSKSYCEAKIAHLLGGRAADEIAGGEPTTGAGDDIKRVTELAKKMVCEWGMSDKIGPMTVGEKDENIFLGKELGRSNNHSEDLTRLVDAEVKSIIEVQYQRCLKILKENEALLHTLASELLDKETLSGSEIDELYQAYLNGSTEKDVKTETKKKSKDSKEKKGKDA
ncbi:MAG TPA: ATP-dependent metallopeptidase FtsH/Yme1/Tma family protein [Candidatus Cloacimonetes bacterium]|nr:ATP-dependent metallopeptidase FtsH/Yme1/Tma family protein [Candidatus Cloacimonadota bacterium]HEX37278.1 ATP-dependent metallopeptidase FtsH/Yme1/Tma family protein [Candidatus Cloacimonadota bacterium]